MCLPHKESISEIDCKSDVECGFLPNSQCNTEQGKLLYYLCIALHSFKYSSYEYWTCLGEMEGFTYLLYQPGLQMMAHNFTDIQTYHCVFFLDISSMLEVMEL